MAVDPFFGSVLAAAGNVAGGLLGHESARKANENAAAQAEANRQAQLTMAQHGIYFRAKDAMHAYESTGIHPLALLGVSGPTYSPVSSAFVTSPIGESIGRAGQDIARGMHATADRELRASAVAMQEAALANSVESGRLDNELRRLQIASERARLAQMSMPAMPRVNQRYALDGQGSMVELNTELRSPLAKGKLNEVTIVDPNRRNVEPGVQPEIGHARGPDGSITLMPGKEFKDRTEDMSWYPLMHFLRNQVGGFFDPDSVAPHPAPPGQRWTMGFDGALRLRDKRYTTTVPIPERRWYRR